MGFVSRNAGREVQSHLLTRFGFVNDEDRPGRYRLPVDAQHQLVITDGTWGKSKEGGHTSANLYFQVARRDINELRGQILNDMGVWWPTLKVDTILFDGDRTVGHLSDFRLDAAAVSAFCDLWVPRFVAEAPRLSYIHEMFAAARAHEKLARSTKIPRMLDSMLEGTWSSDAEAEFFPGLIVPDDQEKIRRWVAENPNGIERELAN